MDRCMGLQHLLMSVQVHVLVAAIAGQTVPEYVSCMCRDPSFHRSSRKRKKKKKKAQTTTTRPSASPVLCSSQAYTLITLCI